MLDIFNDDAFSVVRLSMAIDKLKFVPSRLGSIGLFEPEPVDTIDIAIEERDGVLELIEPTERGGPGVTLGDDDQSLLSIRAPHFEINDKLTADSVQGRRSFGTDNQLETIIARVARKLQRHTQSLDATEEYARAGAIKGIVTYKGGKTLNLFDLFGVDQLDEIDADLDNAAPASGIFRKKCAQIIRVVGDAMDGLPFTGVRAECGDAFFDDLISNKEVVDTYKSTVQAGELRTGYITLANGQTQIWSAFEFGGILWENYRGKVGVTSFIDTDHAHVFPTGAPGLFKSFYAPADYEEAVNTLGQQRYAKQYPMQNGKGRHLDSQTNALHICTRPGVLQQLRRT